MLCRAKLDLVDQDHEDLILRCELPDVHTGSHMAVVYWPRRWNNGEAYQGRHAAEGDS